MAAPNERSRKNPLRWLNRRLFGRSENDRQTQLHSKGKSLREVASASYTRRQGTLADSLHWGAQNHMPNLLNPVSRNIEEDRNVLASLVSYLIHRFGDPEMVITDEIIMDIINNYRLEYEYDYPRRMSIFRARVNSNPRVVAPPNSPNPFLPAQGAAHSQHSHHTHIDESDFLKAAQAKAIGRIKFNDIFLDEYVTEVKFDTPWDSEPEPDPEPKREKRPRTSRGRRKYRQGDSDG